MKKGISLYPVTGELEKTTVIKAKLGTKFGVRYWLSRAGFIGEPTLHLIYHVPTMINPSTGEYVDKIEILQEESKLDYKHTMAFEFANQYELVPGEYRFMYFLKIKNYLKKYLKLSFCKENINGYKKAAHRAAFLMEIKRS